MLSGKLRNMFPAAKTITYKSGYQAGAATLELYHYWQPQLSFCNCSNPLHSTL